MGKKELRSSLIKTNYKYIIMFLGLIYISIYLFYVNNKLKLDNTVMYINLDKCKADLVHKKLVTNQETRLNAEYHSVNWEQFSAIMKSRRDRRVVHTRAYQEMMQECSHCESYDVTLDTNEDYECVPLTTRTDTHICVYSEDEDIFISKSIRTTGTWEGKMVRDFQLWLERDSGLGVLDVGCNIGVYTLAAATLDRDVIAIDPYTEHIKRLHKSISMNSLQHRITVLRNAVSDIRGKAEVVGHTNNQGATVVKQDYPGINQVVALKSDPLATGVKEITHTITLNDLALYCSFSRAILKIDIEGFEHRAFAQADLLFQEVFIPVVMMEWASMNALYWLPEDSVDRKLVENMIDFLLHLDYTPVDWSRTVLHVQMWDTWPKNVIWLHKTFLS